MVLASERNFLVDSNHSFGRDSPFTLVPNSPTEFVIREYDGFTSALVKAARENPGKALRCSIDGGYGQVPNFMRFDRVV